jgi:beta-N-acetylhexosaminidase
MDEVRKLAGRVLMVGPAGHALDSEEARRIAMLAPAGVILFARNLDAPEQTAALLGRVAGMLPHAPLFALDQEGGRVSRLEAWIGPTASAVELARRGASETSRFGAATAAAMRSVGFNLDFAPVVDLSDAAAPNGIGDRSFATDPLRAAELAGAFLDGLQDGGVAGCLKHFPGLGDTDVDSHEVMPTVRASRETLRERELLPYVRLAGNAAAVMVAHAHYPALEGEEPVPATGSRVVVSDLLRRDLDYRGLVVSDDLEMGAVRGLDEDGGFALRAIEAGCDLLLYCADLARAERARDALATRANEDSTFRRKLEVAAERVERTASDWPVAPPRPTEIAAARFDRFRSA